MTIRELLEESRLPRETGRLLEPGPLPPDEEGRVLALALSKAGLEPPPADRKEKTTVKKKHFGLLLLAGVLCAGTVVASAAALFQWDRGLAKALGAGEDQPQGIGGSAIQTSREAEGWTMTLNQAVGDRNCAYLLLDLTAPEGTTLDADYYLLDDCRPVFEKDRSGSWGWGCLEDPDRSDNRISFLLDMKMNGDLRSAKGTLKVSGLQAVQFDPEEQGNDAVERLARLEWELPFRMEYQDEVTIYRPNRTIQLERGFIKGELTVEKVEVGPLSILIRLSGDQRLVRRAEFATGGTPGIGAVLLEIKNREGESIPIQAANGWKNDCIATFLPLIDPADAASIVLDGVEIPLTK